MAFRFLFNLLEQKLILVDVPESSTPPPPTPTGFTFVDGTIFAFIDGTELDFIA